MTTLREFIEETVSPECGGTGSLTSPTSIQETLNECLRRLDRLEAGIGFTVKINDKISLPFVISGDKLIAVVPTNGTIILASTLSTKAGDRDGLKSLTIAVHKTNGSVTESTRELNHKNIAESAILSIPVYTGEWLELTATPYSYTTSSPSQEEGQPDEVTTITSDAKLRAGAIILELPAKVYGVGDAGG